MRTGTLYLENGARVDDVIPLHPLEKRRQLARTNLWVCDVCEKKESHHALRKLEPFVAISVNRVIWQLKLRNIHNDMIQAIPLEIIQPKPFRFTLHII